MKKHLFSFLFVLVGCGLWVALANTARFSIKKWDAKFETVLRHSLDDMGLSPKNLISSVHKVKKDENGEWVTHRIEIDLQEKDKMKRLEKKLESSGAKIERHIENNNPVFLVRRGGRLYQEIHFVKPLTQ